MPELQDDLAARGMNCIRHPAPRRHLRIRVDSRRIKIALPHRADLGGLGDDQASTGTLAVVLDIEIGRDRVWRAVACQRRHHDAVGKRDVAGLKRIEQSCHGETPSFTGLV